MTVQELIDKLLEIPEEHRNKEVYMWEDGGYFSTVTGICSIDFTEDDMLEDDYIDPSVGEYIALTSDNKHL